MQSSSPSRNSFKQSDDPSVSALNTIPGGTYDGNPGDYHAFLQTYRYLKSYKQLPLNLIPPLRPTCLMVEIPDIDIDVAFGVTTDDQNAISTYLRNRSRYEINGQLALVLLRTLLSEQIYHEVSYIFLDETITDAAEQIRLILEHLRLEQNKYKSVAIVTETNVILCLQPATSWSTLQPLMSILEVQYQKLLKLGEPRSPAQQKSDLLRMMSATASDFTTIRSLLFQDHMAAQTYHQWRQFIRSHHINMTAQQLTEITSNGISDAVNPAKRSRYSTDMAPSTGAIYSQRQIAPYLPPEDLTLPHQDDSRMPAWFDNYTNRQAVTQPAKQKFCFNCRASTCPGTADSLLCDKPYCRLCAMKQTCDASGAPDWQWPSKAHPRYHLPPDCIHCHPKYRRVVPPSLPTKSVATHPRPYSYPRSTTKRVIPDYVPPTKSAIHMLLTESDHANAVDNTDMDPMEALLEDYSLA